MVGTRHRSLLIVGVVLALVGAALVPALVRHASLADTFLVLQIGGLVVAQVVALRALMQPVNRKMDELHVMVNSRLSKLLEVTASSERAKGALAGLVALIADEDDPQARERLIALLEETAKVLDTSPAAEAPP